MSRKVTILVRLPMLAVAWCVVASACGSEAIVGPQIVGTDWRLDSIITSDSTIDARVIATPPLVRFTPDARDGYDGRIGGTAGCNALGGLYSQTGSQLTIGELGLTRMLCDDEVSMAIEHAFAPALSAANEYTVEGETLVIATSLGQTLVFTSEGT